MTSIADVRQALAQAIESGAGVVAEPYALRTISAPCVHIVRAGMDPRMVLGAGKAAYEFRCVLFVASKDDVTSQQQIDEFCALSGSTSIKAAIEDGDLWTASVDYASVTRIGDTVERAVADVIYDTVEFSVEVVW